MPLGQTADLLDERSARTTPAVAEVPAHPKPYDDPAGAQRPFLQAALVGAVHAYRPLPAVRAPAWTSGGHRLHQ